MTNELSTERAIEALYTVRAYYASLTAGYPKGKDCRGIGDVMCSEIANSCLRAIQALEQQPCEDYISRQEAIRVAEQGQIQGYEWQFKKLCNLPSVIPKSTDTEELGKTDVLDKIRAEIEERKLNSGGEPNRELAFNVCLKIIDKYRTESEE